MWNLLDKSCNSRFLLGTALFPSLTVMQQSIVAAQTDVITVSLRRQANTLQAGEGFWQYLRELPVDILPNTAGCRNAKEAVMMAQMAREIFDTSWIKVEVIGDDHTLQADPFELIKAIEQLIDKGFQVLPYCSDDVVLCQRLADLGCQVIMPWAAPIGSGQGLLNTFNLRTIRDRLSDITLIIDAGIGKPSDAAEAMQLGYDAVLLNSAVALAHDPVKMATAFHHAIQAGRLAFESGCMPERDMAQASTCLIDTPFWQQESST